MADNTLYLYTSLTAGSSHIVTATARLETILKANKLPFRAIDVATDDTARKLWGRRSRGRKLPGLVKSGMIVGDLEEIEEWNEYGELRMQVNNVQALDSFPDPTTTQPAAPKQSTIKIQSPPSKQESKDSSVSLAMRQASEEAAAKAKENKSNAINKPAAASAATSAAATAAAPTSSGAGPTEKEQPEKKQPEKQQPEKQQPESESATTSTTATTAPTTTTDKQGDDSL